VAVRTVTVDLRLDAGSYLAIARSVVNANNAIDRSLNDLGATAAAAGSAMNHAGRDMAAMGRRARLAERRVKELREEIDRLIAAQAAMRAGGPIPPMIGGATNGGFGGGMLGMLMKVPAPILAAVGSALAATAPAIGSMIGGTLLAALGGGALAVAIVSSVKDVKVRAAFSEFGDFLGEEFRSYGEAFDVPLIKAAERFQDRFASISPKIRGVFAEMSVAVGPLVEGLIGFVEKAGPGIADALRGSLPVLKAIADELPALGQSAGDFFKLVGAGSEGAADGMVALLRLLEMTGYALGGMILYWETLFAAIGDAGPVIQGLLGPLASLTGGAQSVIVPIAGAGYAANDTASAFDRMVQSTLAATEGFNNSYGAAIAYEEAIDNLAASVKENGRSMDIGTEKGRNNARALMEVFEAARRTYDANIASGMSAQEAGRKYQEQIAAARAAALAAGYAADEVNRLAAAQRALPSGTKSFTYKTIFVTEGTRPGGPGGGGTHYAYRDGGIHYARDGLMSFGAAAGIASGGRPLIGFAEPGTGGEAFIARNAPTGRSLAIANTAAGWHGGQVVPKGWSGGGPTMIALSISPGAGSGGDPLVGAVIGMFRDRKIVLRDASNQPVRLAGA
jgi:hypothetical protein